MYSSNAETSRKDISWEMTLHTFYIDLCFSCLYLNKPFIWYFQMEEEECALMIRVIRENIDQMNHLQLHSRTAQILKSLFFETYWGAR